MFNLILGAVVGVILWESVVPDGWKVAAYAVAARIGEIFR